MRPLTSTLAASDPRVIELDGFYATKVGRSVQSSHDFGGVKSQRLIPGLGEN
ncbi:MAG TPA: hypothetical protein VHD87_14605 [Acidimicrobiales bacterium]|nr:hypothetical protein [Acidimicrobiales bacterium]